MTTEHPIRPQTFPEQAMPWHRTTVQHLAAGQPRAYADAENIYEVTFEGGLPAGGSAAGMEIPFHTQPPWSDPKPLPHGSKVIGGPTLEERKATHAKLLRDRIRIIHGWAYDKTLGETGGWHETYLAELEHVRGDAFSNTYRFRVVTPFCD